MAKAYKCDLCGIDTVCNRELRRHVEVTMKIPVRFDEPDKNGVVYTKEAIENAIKSAKNIPITIINDDGSEIPVGVAIEFDFTVEGEKCYMNIDGILRFGGTCKEVEMDGNVVKGFKIASVGIIAK